MTDAKIETKTETAGETLTALAERHKLNKVTLRNWLYLDGVRPIRQTRSGFPRPLFVFDPEAVAACVAGRTPPAGWIPLQTAAGRCGAHPKTLHAAYAAGRVAGAKVNASVYLDPAAVEAWAGTPLRPYPLPAPPRRGRRRESPRPMAEGEQRDPDRRGGEPRTPACFREVPFGPSGLTLCQLDLDFLARVKAKYGRDREGG